MRTLASADYCKRIYCSLCLPAHATKALDVVSLQVPDYCVYRRVGAGRLRGLGRTLAGEVGVFKCVISRSPPIHGAETLCSGIELDPPQRRHP